MKPRFSSVRVGRKLKMPDTKLEAAIRNDLALAIARDFDIEIVKRLRSGQLRMSDFGPPRRKVMSKKRTPERRCSECHEEGHNRRTCKVPERLKELQDVTFRQHFVRFFEGNQPIHPSDMTTEQALSFERETRKQLYAIQKRAGLDELKGTALDLSSRWKDWAQRELARQLVDPMPDPLTEPQRYRDWRSREKNRLTSVLAVGPMQFGRAIPSHEVNEAHDHAENPVTRLPLAKAADHVAAYLRSQRKKLLAPVRKWAYLSKKAKTETSVMSEKRRIKELEDLTRTPEDQRVIGTKATRDGQSPFGMRDGRPVLRVPTSTKEERKLEKEKHAISERMWRDIEKATSERQRGYPSGSLTRKSRLKGILQSLRGRVALTFWKLIGRYIDSRVPNSRKGRR